MTSPTFHKSSCSSVSSLHKREYRTWLEDLMRGLDVTSGGAERQPLDLHDYSEGFRSCGGSSGSSSTIVEEDLHWSNRPRHYFQSKRDSVKSFWREQIHVHIGQDECRDHYALERTFLAYMRTSLAFAMLGIYIAQLFRLQHLFDSEAGFGFFMLGTPLACTCIGAAIVIAVLGAYRFWRQQNAMLRGKIHVWGWEMAAIGITALIVTMVMFALIIVANVDTDPGFNLPPILPEPQWM